MDHWLVGGILAALIGALISLLNYRLSLYIVKKKPDMLAMMSVPRQIINIVYLVAVYLLAEKTPWELMPLLVGAALGLTGTMFVCTRLLLKAVETAPGTEQNHGGDDNG